MRDRRSLADSFGTPGRHADAEFTTHMVTFNALLSACGKGGRWKLILDIVDRMGKAKIDPDAISYNTAICSFEMGEKWEMAMGFPF